jgi:uncharacterized membrane protein
MAAIVFALLSAILYGSADFLGGLASRRSSVMPVMIFSQLAGLLTLLLMLPFLPAATATRADFAWGAMAGGALGIGLMLLYQGLATGKMSVVAPITAILAVVVSAVAGMVIGDRLSAGAFAGVALAITAITLISQDRTREKAKAGHGWGASHGLAAALSAGVLIGVFFAALKQTSPASGLLPLVAARLAALVALGAVSLWRRPPWHVGRDVVWLIVAGGARHLRERALPLGHARGHADYRRDNNLTVPREHDPSRTLGSRRTTASDSNRRPGVRRARRCAPRRRLDYYRHADPAIFLPVWSMLSSNALHQLGKFRDHALRRHRVKPDRQFLRQHDRVCRRIRTCMIVIKRKGLFHSGRAGSSFDPLRVLFDFFARVQVIVAFPGLLRIPPRFGVAAMGAKVKYVADRFGLLADRSRKLRLVDQNPASSVL